MTSPNAIFVDTNVLIYATNPSSPWHRAAAQSLTQNRAGNIDLVVSVQVLREYIAAATRQDSRGRKVPISDVLANVKVFERDFRVAEDGLMGLRRLMDIITEVPVAGRLIHDANIVATMQVNGIQHLLTHNLADFRIFSKFISIITLERIASS